MSDKKIKTEDSAVEAELQIAKEEVQRNLEGWKRAQADLINFKKDEERGVAEILKYGNSSLVLEIIGLLDNLETALANVPAKAKKEHKDWFDGFEKTIKSLADFLEKHHVKKIKSVGEKFDPLMHEAVMMEGQDAKFVLEEYRTGYMMHDRVIRPSRVKVGK